MPDRRRGKVTACLSPDRTGGEHDSTWAGAFAQMRTAR
jgi:hypothetical protein